MFVVCVLKVEQAMFACYIDFGVCACVYGLLCCVETVVLDVCVAGLC